VRKGKPGHAWSPSAKKWIAVTPLDTGPSPKARKPKQPDDRYIGCPFTWLKRVLSLVKSKDQLVVALYLQRRRAVCRSRTFTVPNQELAELGVTRQAKYRALRHLEQAGEITITRNGKQAMQVILRR
jgi:hypothetical protein